MAKLENYCFRKRRVSSNSYRWEIFQSTLFGYFPGFFFLRFLICQFSIFFPDFTDLYQWAFTFLLLNREINEGIVVQFVISSLRWPLMVSPIVKSILCSAGSAQKRRILKRFSTALSFQPRSVWRFTTKLCISQNRNANVRHVTFCWNVMSFVISNLCKDCTSCNKYKYIIKLNNVCQR